MQTEITPKQKLKNKTWEHSILHRLCTRLIFLYYKNWWGFELQKWDPWKGKNVRMHYYFVTKKLECVSIVNHFEGSKLEWTTMESLQQLIPSKKLRVLTTFYFCQNWFPIGKGQWGAWWEIQGTWSWWSILWDSNN